MLHLHVQYIFDDFQPDVPVATDESVPVHLCPITTLLFV